jgi:NAD(P)-dependent dehydrogenase (short-subunit alcohol dehydrogenase family)
VTSRAWTTADIPRQDGKIIVVTGANSGIGFEAARALAGAGAHVVLACRKRAAADEAVEKIRAEHPAASLEFGELDLASLTSVRAFAAGFAGRHARLDVLINNAGLMALPYQKTVNGFETQLGVNHLGHFALTGLLLGLAARSAPSRVVTVSSLAHQMGAVDFDDLHRERSYQKWTAYGQSKLCNLLFAYELDRRLRARGLPVRSVACHPGYSATNLQYAGPRMVGSTWQERMWGAFNRWIAQDAATGALPTLFAAVAPEAEGGDFIGPARLGMWGAPVKVTSNARSRDEALARRLWEVSEQLTGVSFEHGLSTPDRAA